jgi:hypothetical protein
MSVYVVHPPPLHIQLRISKTPVSFSLCTINKQYTNELFDCGKTVTKFQVIPTHPASYHLLKAATNNACY